MAEININSEIRARLNALSDQKYKEFQGPLIPSVDPGAMLGVRTPDLRRLAKELSSRPDVSEFLAVLPHKYFDETQLHAFIISEIKDFRRCLTETERFLPFVNNWATCDQLSPKVFKKHPEELLAAIYRWLGSKHTYTVRFAIGMLMEHYLDDNFSPAYTEAVAAVRSDDYYVQMMAAWYFATALAKQYDTAVKYLEGSVLDVRVHNKAIQKAIESRRITPEQKIYLKSLKRKMN